MQILFLEEYLQELVPFPFCLYVHKVQMSPGNFNTGNKADTFLNTDRQHPDTEHRRG